MKKKQKTIKAWAIIVERKIDENSQGHLDIYRRKKDARAIIKDWQIEKIAEVIPIEIKLLK